MRTLTMERRRYLLWLWLGYLLFIFYGVSLPFHIDARQASQKWQKIIESPHLVDDFSLPDLLSNVLLFVPFGLFLGAHWMKPRCSQLSKIGVVGFVSLVGAAFSVCYELWQLFLPARTTSLLDVIANTTGAFGGAVVGVALSEVADSIGTTRRQFLLASYPVTLLLIAVLLVQSVGSLLPLDISIDIGDLKENLKQANLQPLGSLTIRGQPAAPFSASQFLEGMWLFGLIGWLFGTCAHWEWKACALRAFGLGLATVGLLAVVDFLQLVIRSRRFDVNVTLSHTAGFGLGCGAFLTWLLFSQSRKRANITVGSALRALIGPYVILLALSELNPFDLSFTPANIAARWKAVELLPFGSYYSNTSLWSVQDLLETIILAVPAGLWVGWRFRQKSGRGVAYLGLIAGLVLGTILEASQLLTQSRYPGITDVMSFGIGASFGSVLTWRSVSLRTSFGLSSKDGHG